MRCLKRVGRSEKKLGIFLKNHRHLFEKSSGAFFEMFGMNFWREGEGCKKWRKGS